MPGYMAAIKLDELGTLSAEIMRKLSIAEQTFYPWKRRYANLDPGRRARQVLCFVGRLQQESASPGVAQPDAPGARG